MGTEYDIHVHSKEKSPLHHVATAFGRDVRCACIEARPKHVVDRNGIDQIYRSGTSVGANIRESKFAQSDKDFINKLKIAEKELAEFFYWLGILMSTEPCFVADTATRLMNSGLELHRILSSIITTMKRKNQGG